MTEHPSVYLFPSGMEGRVGGEDSLMVPEQGILLLTNLNRAATILQSIPLSALPAL